MCSSQEDNLKINHVISPEIHPKRHLYYEGRSVPIAIETSDRTSHQVASRILRLLLQEVLGYAKVEIKSGYNSINATQVLNRI